APAIIGIAEFVNRHRKRILGDRSHQFAAFNLVRRGGSLVAITHRVADTARHCGAYAHVPHCTLTFFRVGGAELLTRNVIAYPEGLINNERLQLGIPQLRRGFLLEVGYSHTSWSVLARVGAGRVPDG